MSMTNQPTNEQQYLQAKTSAFNSRLAELTTQAEELFYCMTAYDEAKDEFTERADINREVLNLLDDMGFCYITDTFPGTRSYRHFVLYRIFVNKEKAEQIRNACQPIIADGSNPGIVDFLDKLSELVNSFDAYINTHEI